MSLMTMTIPLARVFVYWRPGSYDWTWEQEFSDCWSHFDKMGYLMNRVRMDGIGFDDAEHPILLGSDGRVWDGHHRLAIALERELHEISVAAAT